MRILDEEKYPDGISSPLEDLNDWVWEKGYYCQTEEGIWYELYLSRDQRKYYPNTKVLEETMDETNCIWEILKNTIKLLFLSLMTRRSGHLRN